MTFGSSSHTYTVDEDGDITRYSKARDNDQEGIAFCEKYILEARDSAPRPRIRFKRPLRRVPWLLYDNFLHTKLTVY